MQLKDDIEEFLLELEIRGNYFFLSDFALSN